MVWSHCKSPCGFTVANVVWLRRTRRRGGVRAQRLRAYIYIYMWNLVAKVFSVDGRCAGLSPMRVVAEAQVGGDKICHQTLVFPLITIDCATQVWWDHARDRFIYFKGYAAQQVNTRTHRSKGAKNVACAVDISLRAQIEPGLELVYSKFVKGSPKR